jgi:hypothetical protein
MLKDVFNVAAMAATGRPARQGQRCSAISGTEVRPPNGALRL